MGGARGGSGRARGGPRVGSKPLSGAWARTRRNAAAGGSNGASRHRRARSRRSFASGDRRGRRRGESGRASAGRPGRKSAHIGPGRIADEPAVRTRTVDRVDGASAREVFLFGAGHVGRALALALAPLPFAVRWINSRRDAFPARAGERRRWSIPPSRRPNSPAAPDGALIVVMTHSHALDLEIVAAALGAGASASLGSSVRRPSGRGS